MRSSDRHNILNEKEFIPENTAVILLNTSLFDYEFAAALNRIFRLELARDKDIDIFSAFSCPFFYYFDDDTHLLSMLIENTNIHPIDSLLAEYDKILLINGRDAFDFQRRIFASLSRDPRLLSAVGGTLVYQIGESDSALDTLCQNIVDVHYFDFSNPSEVKSSFSIPAKAAQSPSRKTKRSANAVSLSAYYDLLIDLLLYVQDYFVDVG